MPAQENRCSYCYCIKTSFPDFLSLESWMTSRILQHIHICFPVFRIKRDVALRGRWVLTWSFLAFLSLLFCIPLPSFPASRNHVSIPRLLLTVESCQTSKTVICPMNFPKASATFGLQYCYSLVDSCPIVILPLSDSLSFGLGEPHICVWTISDSAFMVNRQQLLSAKSSAELQSLHNATTTEAFGFNPRSLDEIELSNQPKTPATSRRLRCRQRNPEERRCSPNELRMRGPLADH